jgi:hypothetical protein
VGVVVVEAAMEQEMVVAMVGEEVSAVRAVTHIVANQARC